MNTFRERFEEYILERTANHPSLIPMIMYGQGEVRFRLVCKDTLNHSNFSSWFDEASPGRDERNWIHRTTFTVPGVIQTAPDEISLFVSRNYTYPSAHLERMTLRIDGFVSINGGYSGGEFVTKPLLFQGDNLVLSFSTSAAGSIRVEIQDVKGNTLPGFALEESPLISSYPKTRRRPDLTTPDTPHRSRATGQSPPPVPGGGGGPGSTSRTLTHPSVPATASKRPYLQSDSPAGTRGLPTES